MEKKWIIEKFNANSFEIFFFTLLALTLFMMLGSSSLWEPDEPRYAEAVREMYETGDFLTPHYNYEYRFDKPILYYWLIAVPYKIFGMNEFALRFPSAFFSFLTVLFIYLIVKRLYGRSSAIASALVLATLYNFIKHGRYAIPDAAFIFFITAAFYFFIRGLSEHKNSMRNSLSGYVMLALATLTKSPLGFIIPGIAFGTYMLIRRDWTLFKRMHVGWGILVFVVIAFPWYLYMLLRYKADYFNYYVLSDHMSRFFTSEFGRPRPFYYYLQILLGDFLPWTPFLLISLKNKDLNWKNTTRKTGDNFTFIFLLWALTVLVIFSLSGTKVPHYITPAYPPLAVLTGILIGKLIDKSEKLSRLEKLSQLIIMTVILSVGALLTIHAVNLMKLETVPFLICIPSLISIAGFLWLVFIFKEKNLYKFVTRTGVLLLLLYLGIIIFLMPAYESSKPVKNISEHVKSIIKTGEAVALYKTINPAVMYYVHRKVETITTAADLEKFLSKRERVFVITKAINIYDFQNRINTPFYELMRRIRYLPRFSNFYKSPQTEPNFELVLLSNKPETKTQIPK